MKSRLLVPALITAIGLALTVIAVACGDEDGKPSAGGNGELSLQGYFEGVDAIFEKGEAASVEAGEPPKLEGCCLPFEEKIVAAKDFLGAHLGAFTDVVNDMEALDPPAEVEEAHNDFLAAARDVQQAGQDIIENKVDPVQSDTEFGPLLDEFYFVRSEPLAAACQGLQAVADDNNIDVDLSLVRGLRIFDC